MKRFLKRVSSIAAAFVITATPLFVLSPTVNAAPDTCTWTGASNILWSEPTNWTGCDGTGAPEDGDALVFPFGAANTATNNDFANLSVTSISITGIGYSISGNVFTVTGAAGITATESATINNDFIYDSFNKNFGAAAGRTLTTNGTISLVTGGGEVNVGGPLYGGTVDFTFRIIGDAGSQFIAVNGATAIVRGINNTFTASNVGAESDATFECRAVTCFGNIANAIYSGGGIVDIYTSSTFNHGFLTSGATFSDSIINAYDNVSITGPGTVNDAIFLNQNASSSGKSLQFTGPINNNSSITTSGSDLSQIIRFDTGISGVGSIAANGATTRLNNANTFNGTVSVASGAVLSASNSASLGSTLGSTTISSGGTLHLNQTSAVTIPEELTIEGSGVTSLPGAIYSDGADDAILSGAVILTNDATIRSSSLDGDIEITGTISGNGNLSLAGLYDAFNSGSIDIDGASPNTYTGATYVLGGVVYLDKTGSVPGDAIIDTEDPTNNPSTLYFYGDNAIVDTGTITMNDSSDSARFGFVGTETFGGLSGADGEVSFTTSGANIAIDQSFNSTFGGDWYSDGESVTVTKRGTGILTLTGNDNFNGDEIDYVVEAGTLIVNGSLKTTAGGNIAVQAAGTLKGSGTIGAITSTGGKIAPGNSPGTINVSGLTLDASSVFEAEIAGPTAGTQYDQLIATGAVNLGGATLNVLPSYTPAAGAVFTIIQAGSVTGTFNGVSDGSTYTANGVTFRVNYTGTTVTLTYLSGTASATPGTPNTGLKAQSIISYIAAGLLGLAIAGYQLRRSGFGQRFSVKQLFSR